MRLLWLFSLSPEENIIKLHIGVAIFFFFSFLFANVGKKFPILYIEAIILFCKYYYWHLCLFSHKSVHIQCKPQCFSAYALPDCYCHPRVFKPFILVLIVFVCLFILDFLFFWISPFWICSPPLIRLIVHDHRHSKDLCLLNYTLFSGLSSAPEYQFLSPVVTACLLEPVVSSPGSRLNLQDLADTLILREFADVWLTAKMETAENPFCSSSAIRHHILRAGR